MTVSSMIPHESDQLPAKVLDVPKELLRNFPHSKKVGNYLLGNTLGEGSFAKVKEALHIPTGERVAIKIIDKKKSREDSYVRKNLRREGKILQMVRHRHVVQLHEIMETQNSYYLVTELCRGGDLMDYISQKKRLPEMEVKKYIRQIVSAVDYLHRQGILHRDLKIENLLLDEYKDMKIIDFGLSNCVKVAQTKDGPRHQELCVTQCGSPAYAAPELLGRQKYGPQVDVWSIGINMYAMLTGNLPFTVEPFNIKALHSKMVNGDMNPLPDNVSNVCRDILKRFLNPNPDRRITLEDTFKHPWIAEGPGRPMARAPCPNKIKTDSLEPGILRHMSENLGFRVGEVIRYVTGNVPSSATAMYHLINRKLMKHYGTTRPATRCSTNISNNKIPYTMQKAKADYTARQPSADVHCGERKSRTEPASDAGSGTATPSEVSDETGTNFASVIDTKRANGHSHAQRVPSAARAKKPASHLPHTAGKYVVATSKTTTKQTTIHTRPVSPSVELKAKRDTNTPIPEEVPFRKRASTFPGKLQRPKINLNQLRKDKGAGANDQERSESVATNFCVQSNDVDIDNPETDMVNVKLNNYTARQATPSVGQYTSDFEERCITPLTQRTDTSHTSTYVSHMKQTYLQRRKSNNRISDVYSVNDSKVESHPGQASGIHVHPRAARPVRITHEKLIVRGGQREQVHVDSFDITPRQRQVNQFPVTHAYKRVTTPALPSISPVQAEESKKSP